MKKGVQAIRTVASMIKSIRTANLRRWTSSGCASDMNIFAMVMSSGIANTNIIVTVGAITVGNKRQSLVYTEPSAKGAAVTTASPEIIRSERNAPRRAKIFGLCEWQRSVITGSGSYTTL